jgi:peptidoglycan/LPS O-acetylase OafA/YrhL
MQPAAKATQPKEKAYYLTYLDATRGIAALMVAIYHFIGWRDEHALLAELGSIVFNGADAVSYFFVLSGFVLSYKYIVLGDKLDIKKFYVNRLFRIWPAFFVTVLLNALYWNRKDLGINNLQNLFIFNRQDFWEEALLFRGGHSKFYVPGWTLSIELTASFFMPFAIALARKDKRIIPWLIFATLLLTFEFIFPFMLGVLASCLYQRVTDPAFKETKWFRYRHLIITGAFILFSIRILDRISPLGPSYKYLAGYLVISFFHYSAFASFIFLIMFLQNKRLQRVLSHSWFRFIGKVSYGIYLMHWLIVTIIFENWDYLVSLFHGTILTYVVTFPVFLAVTLLLAYITYQFIERPFIRMGKKLTAKMKPSVAV